MAEQAQKEPTMEEILSSIRKIIADDDAPVVSAEPETAEDLNVFEDDMLEAEPETDGIESEEDVLAAISQSMEEATEELEAEAEAEAEIETESEESFDFVVEEDSFDAFEDNDFEGVEDLPARSENSFPVWSSAKKLAAQQRLKASSVR